jgi:hypothetical protein
VNNSCSAAIAIGDGTITFNTTGATTDGLALPESLCDKGFGVSFDNDIWYNFTALITGETTIDMCDGTMYDSRVAVYEGCTCPALNTSLLGCNDDNCGDPIIIGGPSGLTFPVTQGNCYKVRFGGFEGATGMGMAEFTTASVPSDECPPGAVVFTDPLNNTVDARQPHGVGATMPAQGIQVITVTAPANAEPSCWSLCETANTGTPNAIQSVAVNGTTYTITLARPITPSAVTRLTYTDDNNATTTGTFVFHPGNVNANGFTNPQDILATIDCLNNVNPMINCPWGVYSRDIDHSGAFGPPDILRVIDLLNGAGAYDPWINTPLPTNPGICP